MSEMTESSMHSEDAWGDLLGLAYGTPPSADADGAPPGEPAAPNEDEPRSRAVGHGHTGAATRAFRAYQGCMDGIELFGEIGRGGFGVVLRGRDLTMQRDVAVKVLHRHQAHDPQAIASLVREAQTAGQLLHPSILPVFSRGTDRLGRPYFTMPWIEGETLASLLERPERIPQPLGLRALSRACQAIQHAHDHGVTHNDLKPGNLWIDAAHHPWILDWGFSQPISAPPAANPPPADLEKTPRSLRGVVRCGTPGYMAPELRAVEPPSPHPTQDVFALGAMLEEILTRSTHPVSREPREALVELCQRCQEEQPHRRPQSAGALGSWIDLHLERARTLTQSPPRTA